MAAGWSYDPSRPQIVEIECVKAAPQGCFVKAEITRHQQMSIGQFAKHSRVRQPEAGKFRVLCRHRTDNVTFLQRTDQMPEGIRAMRARRFSDHLQPIRRYG